MNKAAFALAGFGFAASAILFSLVGPGSAPANAQIQTPSPDDSNRCVSAADSFVRNGKLQLNARNAFVDECAGMESFAVTKLNERLNHVPNTIAEHCAKETIGTGGLYVDYARCQDETLNQTDDSQLRQMSYWRLIRNGRPERLFWTALDCREAAQPKFQQKEQPTQATGVCVSK